MKIKLNEHFGFLLRARRRNLKLSQLECAKRIGISDKAIRNIELCKISSIILDYSNHLNISFFDLLDIEFSDEKSDILFTLIKELEAKKTEEKV